MNNSNVNPGGSSFRYSSFVYCSIMGTISPIIVVGNVFTIVIFSTRKSGSNRAHILLISLAVADILVGAISVPLFIYLMGSQQKWWGSKGSRIINLIYGANDILAGFASIFCLVCIALERLYAIKWPMKHRLTTKRAYYYCLALIWFTSGLIAALRFVVKFLTLAYIIVISFGLSFLLIFTAYITLWYSVKNRKVDSAKRQRETKTDRKLAKTLILVTLVFVLTWVPFQVVLAVFYYFCLPSCYPLSLTAFYATKILHYANSMANPTLYVFRIKVFRDSIIDSFKCKRCKTETHIANSTLHTAAQSNLALEYDTKL